MFLHGRTSVVSVNGELSRPVKIGRSCPQGDALSPYAFILCLEIAAIKLRASKEITGFILFNKEHRLDLFADDTGVWMGGNQRTMEISLRAVVKIFDLFAEQSGLILNRQKTEVVYFGSLQNQTDIIGGDLGLKKTAKFKHLGIMFTPNLDCLDENVHSRLEIMGRP